MKKFLMLLAVSSMSLGAMAQETETAEKTQYDEYAVVTNSFWDNWFISGGVGASALLGDYDNKGDFGKRIRDVCGCLVAIHEFGFFGHTKFPLVLSWVL